MGTATLTNTNVYQNEARYVCSPIDHSLNCHPAPRWNVTCAYVWQCGGGLRIDGTATLTDTNVYSNQARLVCLPFERSLSFHPAPRWNVTCAHGWQAGGGLVILGTATLINTNVYANQAGDVCSPFELALNSHPAPRWNVTCPRFSWQDGGGLSVYGMATLTNTNVYSNQADYVCSPIQLSLNFHPSPRWNVTRSALFACRVVGSTSLARQR